MENLKKQYRYYKKLEESGSINDKQQEKLKSIVEKLGEDNIPHQKVKQTAEEAAAKRHEYYLANREKIISYQKQWNKQNRDKCAEYNKKAYEKKKVGVSRMPSPE